MKIKKIYYGLLITPLLFSCADLNSSSFSSESFSSDSYTSESTSDDSGSLETSLDTSTSDDTSTLPPIDYVVVFAPIHYSHIYAWEDDGTNILGDWPGINMKAYDDTWNMYDFIGYSTLNVIFNVGSNVDQTMDLHINEAGYYWYYDNELHKTKPGENEPDIPKPPYVEAQSWKDFKFWDEYPKSHWTIINKYKGDRVDFRQESIYFAITTRFYDGDSSNNMECWDGKNTPTDPAWRGDFKGLIEKMDYIKALGFTSIWITPVVENASGYDYHGYHALNFEKVDERYLSQDVDFQDVINAAHSKDMKIILDVVFNHTGNFGETNIFPMFEKDGDLSSFDCMKQTPNSPLPSNYDSLNAGQQYDARIQAMKTEKGDPKGIYHHYGNFSWETFGEQVAQIAGDCVDLNTENPEVAEYLVKCYGQFIKMGVDAFRIDTMKHISRLTLNNYIFPALYEYARRCGNENFFMYGEVCTRVREVWNHNIPALSAPFYTWK